jgi:hypothetical protein
MNHKLLQIERDQAHASAAAELKAKSKKRSHKEM